MAVSVGTLTDAPAFVATLTSSRRAVQSPAVSGFVQRRQVQSGVSANSDQAEVRRWRLEWRIAPAAVRSRILALWNDSFGGASAITWTPLDESSSLLCRFSIPPRFVRRSYAGYAISLELEEML